MTFFNQLQQATAEHQQRLHSSRVFAAVADANIDVESYRHFLLQAFHHVKHTVSLLMLCGARLPTEYEWLRKAMMEYIEEEYGHEQWILNDIEALGGDRQQAIESIADPYIQLMVSYLYDAIERRHPVALLGMVFMLEGTSTQVATGMAKKIKQALSLPASAFTYMMSHGELDVQHIGFYETLVNRIDDEQHRQLIIESAQMCFRCYTAMLNNIPLPQQTGGVKHEAA